MGRKAETVAGGEGSSQLDVGRDMVSASTSDPRDAVRFLGDAHLAPRRGPAPGSAPGLLVVPVGGPKPVIRVMSYDEAEMSEVVLDRAGQLSDVVASGRGLQWIDVEGFGDEAVLSEIGERLGIHPLAMADLVHVPQRPKIELHEDRLLMILQMTRLDEDDEIVMEQVGLVLGPGWVASFQERPGDVFDPVRERIRLGQTRIRRMGPDYLAYALLDAVIDGYFPVLEAIGGVVDALEEDVIEDSSRASLARIHATRRSLTTLHRVQWRQRDAITSLLRDDELPFSVDVKPYLRDVHDHAFQTLDGIETLREMVVGLMDLYLSSTSNRQSEVMQTLTIVATIFIPLTFLAGVYGMNFDYMPELHWHWSYPAVWGVMIVLGAGLLVWFRRRGWLGDGDDE